MTTPNNNPAATAHPFLTCREVLDFIMAYLDGELAPGQKLEFERHLGVCKSCVNYLDSYKATIKLGKTAMIDSNQPAAGTVPEGLLHAVRAARLKSTP